MPSHPTLEQFFSTNKQWAAKVNSRDSEFFANSARGQAPKILWFGCADSRVPESVVLAVKPGEVFVHRNIANQFHPDDDSANAVLTFGVESLNIQHVVVVGHSQCGGIKGAYGLACGLTDVSSLSGSPLGRWLIPLVQLARSHNLPSQGEEKSIPQLTAASVKQQVSNIAKSSVIQNAWANGNPVTIHGWVYNLETGTLEDLDCDVTPPNY
ncbi:carbonic anhydrase [Serendipita vermifera]|nr:carbonic anhydrase [Serendipita vermifera]